MVKNPRNNPEAGQQIVHENRPYLFSAYDDAWPQMFTELATEIGETLGEGVVDLEHVGSTSIPGMSAKPQIDVLVTVNNFDDIPSFYDAMTDKGFTPRGDYTNEGEEYFTKDGSNGDRLASVHVLPVGHHWAGELLAFRDYLRSHPDEMEYYRSAKQRANQQYLNDYTNYYKTKDPVLREVKARALAWAQLPPAA